MFCSVSHKIKIFFLKTLIVFSLMKEMASVPLEILFGDKNKD